MHTLRRHFGTIPALTALLLALSFVAATAAAAPEPQEFTVPAGEAGQTLGKFAAQSRQPVVFPTDQVQGVRTHAVSGRHTPAGALELMLAGTPLAARVDSQSGTLVVVGRVGGADQIIELPPYLVEESGPSAHWTYASAPGIEVLSRCSDKVTKLLIERHYLLHDMLRLLLPEEFQVHFDVPTTYVLFNSDDQPRIDPEIMADLRAGQRDSSDWLVRGMSNYRFWDRDAVGVFFVINERTFVDGSLSMTADYVRFIAEQRTPSLPPWFVEGMLEVFLRANLATTPPFASLAASAGGNMPLPPGSVTVRTAVWISVEETQAVRRRPGFHHKLLPLASVFAPLPPTGADHDLWRAEAALFVRWALDGGPTQPRREALWKFLRSASQQPVTEALFRDCFGLTLFEAEEQLRAYLPEAVRHSFTMRTEKLPDPPTVTPTPASPADVSRLKGRLDLLEISYVRARYPQLAARYVAQARRTLRRSYAEGDHDPRLLAELGLCECEAGNDANARLFLEAAVRARVVRPRAYYELARIRCQQLTASVAKGIPLPADAVGEALQPLLPGLRQSPPQAEAYELIAAMWLRADGRLTPAQLALLAEGIRLFPWRARLIYPVALLNSLNGRGAEAFALADRGLRITADPKERNRFSELQEALRIAPVQSSP